MFKLFIGIILLFFSANVNTPSLNHCTEECFSKQQVHCCSNLKDILKTIQKIPKVNALIENVLEEGPISIEINRDFPNKFEGYWSSENRTIYLTQCKGTSKEGLITSLLFELHNAKRDSDFAELDNLAYQQQIGKRKYVESVEYIEYQNALKTSALIKEGIARKIFPQGCQWNLPDNFQRHFSIQKEMGHSAWIAESYDILTKAKFCS